jgi:hypothetical protein
MDLRLGSPLLVGCLVLTGCAVQAMPSPAASPSPSQTPSFDIRLEAEVSVVQSATAGEWLVLGLVRTGAQEIEAPRLVIVLENGSGEEIARRTVHIPADPLPAGASWAFRETFRPTATPGSAEAMLLGEAGSRAQAPEVDGEVVRTFLDAQGGTVALGSLTNEEAGPIRIEHVRLVGRASSGVMREVIEVVPARDGLHGGDQTPFLAEIPRGREDLEWEVHTIAVADGDPPSVIEVLDTHSTMDDQGNPFVTAVLRNISPSPVLPTLTAIARDGAEWLSGGTVSLPVPLAPGERTAASLRVPAVGLPEEGEIDWLLVPDATPAESGPIHIACEVVGFRPVGSTLFLQVRLTGGDAPSSDPAAFAWVADDEGTILSAGWAAGPPMLAPGQTAIVTVALPVPRDIDLAMAQIDVRASGLP